MKTLEDLYLLRHLEMVEESLRDVLDMGFLFESAVQRHHSNLILGFRRRLFSEDKSKSCAEISKLDPDGCAQSDLLAARLAEQIFNQGGTKLGCLLYRCRGLYSSAVIPIRNPLAEAISGPDIVGHVFLAQRYVEGDDNDIPEKLTKGRYEPLIVYTCRPSDLNHLSSEDKNLVYHGFCCQFKDYLDIANKVTGTIGRRLKERHHIELPSEDSNIHKRIRADYRNRINVDEAIKTLEFVQGVVNKLFLEYNPDKKEEKIEEIIRDAIMEGRKRFRGSYIAMINHGHILEEMEHPKNLIEARTEYEEALKLAEVGRDEAAVKYIKEHLKFVNNYQNVSADYKYTGLALLRLHEHFARPAVRKNKPKGVFGRMQSNIKEKENFIRSKSKIHNLGYNFLTFLQRWNSYTPLLDEQRVSGFEESKPENSSRDLKGFGGGIFLVWEGTGIVIDPGTGFLRHFFGDGFCISDIDAIICTHAHIDHTGDLEAILTLLKEHNTLRRKGPKKKVTLFLNQGTMTKFLGWFDLDQDYIREHITLVPSLKISRHPLNDHICIVPIHAFHDEIVSTRYSLGIFFELKSAEGHSFSIWYTGDTGFNNKGGTKSDVKDLKMVVQTMSSSHLPIRSPDLLIVNIGSVNACEFDLLKTGTPKFYDYHLGIVGLVKLLEIVRPCGVIITEFGEEFGSFRLDIARLTQYITTVSGSEVPILPADIDMLVRLPKKKGEQMEVRCIDDRGFYVRYDEPHRMDLIQFKEAQVGQHRTEGRLIYYKK